MVMDGGMSEEQVRAEDDERGKATRPACDVVTKRRRQEWGDELRHGDDGADEAAGVTWRPVVGV